MNLSGLFLFCSPSGTADIFGCSMENNITNKSELSRAELSDLKV